MTRPTLRLLTWALVGLLLVAAGVAVAAAVSGEPEDRDVGSVVVITPSPEPSLPAGPTPSDRPTPSERPAREDGEVAPVPPAVDDDDDDEDDDDDDEDDD
ncbi:hypothetical protein [Isoptericola sp. G70]|uniref:hypothetical protein n=1 Tax=Isoptericola sp. G70 TaxID=3376633 RepID=UPI003A80F815